MARFKPIYMHRFTCDADIISEFAIPADSLAGCRVLLAYYHVGNYGCDSSAYVLFEKEGALYEVHGSHCSCHGLESISYNGGGTQWEPEQTIIESLEHRMEKGSFGYPGGYDDVGYAAECKRVLKYLRKRGGV